MLSSGQRYIHTESLARLGCVISLRHASSISAAKQKLSPVHDVGPRSPKVSHIPPSILSFHWDTSPPTESQLVHAENFFRAKPAEIEFSASKFRTVALTSVPEVAFLGRSNVGKSSLLNALFGVESAWVSAHPGRTKTMNAFAVGGEDSMGNKGKINVLDMPGYGKGSRQEWGKEITKYLIGRKQLKRAFLMVDALHGLKGSDAQMLELFRHNNVPHQVIVSKVDRVLLAGSKHVTEAVLEERVQALRDFVADLKKKIQPKDDGPPALGEILTCCSGTPKSKRTSPLKSGVLNINAVRWAVLAATGAVPGKRMILSRNGIPLEIEKIGLAEVPRAVNEEEVDVEWEDEDYDIMDEGEGESIKESRGSR